MADITMCCTICCPLGQSCYRKQARPSLLMQSWAAFAFDYDNKGRAKCENYIPMEKPMGTTTLKGHKNETV